MTSKLLNVTLTLLVILLVLLGIVYLVNSAILKPQNAQAGTSQNVSGFAWANTPQSSGTPQSGTDQGVGWISFNSHDCDVDQNGFTDSGLCGGNNTSTVARDYGVNISPLVTGTGNFSGTAWSEHIGWISFNRGVTGAPPQSPYIGGAAIAKVDWSTGIVTGWARALSACTQDDSGNLNPSRCVQDGNSGGWDGWIRLSADEYPTWDGNGVKIDTVTNKFSGYAWGGDVLGWIQFSGTATNGSPYEVIVNLVAAPSPCTDRTIGTCNLTAVPSGSSSGSCVSGYTGSCNYSCDDAAWTEVSNFCMPASPLTVSCTGSPLTALLGENITWTATIDFGGGTPPFSYSWSGTNISSPVLTTDPYYTRSYSTIGEKTARVTVTDSDSPPANATCPAASVRINFDPDFEEF